jgi:hypothetical protein
MSTSTDESPRLQHDRERQPGRDATAGARRLHMRASEISTPRPGPHAGFDADLNPIDDELINTHGSER